MADDLDWQLALPFDTDDSEFARGCEVGMMWAALRFILPDRKHDVTISGRNAEMALRIAEATHRPLTTYDMDADWIAATFGPVEDGYR